MRRKNNKRQKKKKKERSIERKIDENNKKEGNDGLKNGTEIRKYDHMNFDQMS